MKKYILVIILGLILSNPSKLKSQDIIKLLSGQEWQVKVIQEYDDSVLFYYSQDSLKIIHSLKRKYIDKVDYHGVPVKFPIDLVSKKVIYTGVVQVDSSLNANTLYNILKEWFASDVSKFYRSSSEKGSGTNDAIWGTKKANMATVDLSFKNDQPLKLDDPANKKLLGRVVCKYFGTSMGCVRLLYLTFDIKIQAKDGKYKYDISNFDYTHYNHYSASKIGFNVFSDKGPCKSTGPIEELLQCENCTGGLEKFYNYIDTEVNKLILDVKEFVNKNKVNTSW
ncbi:MAG: hypothetical protein NTX61_18750 [Bacteroidetes bacterium]|nr:hypothetical protein [Bacteroidota bacterium]